MTRCPVPYALLALLGWGALDALIASARVRWRALRPRLSPARLRTP